VPACEAKRAPFFFAKEGSPGPGRPIVVPFHIGLASHTRWSCTSGNFSPANSVDGSIAVLATETSTFGALEEGCTINDVTVSVNFGKHDGTCSAPNFGGIPFHSEFSFSLQAPDGEVVMLIAPGTYSGATGVAGIAITFVNSGGATVNGGVPPASGTFLPTDGNNFNDIIGRQIPAGGNWVLLAGDSSAGDPLCINSYSFTVHCQCSNLDWKEYNSQ
jgi:hypothetical protein